MQISSLRGQKTRLQHFTISTFLIVLFLIYPVEVFAQDAGSIDVLRQMGKAFAGIAENASPAVVGIKTEKSVSRGYKSPFGGPSDPFGDDFFEHFFRRGLPRRRSPQPKSRQLSQGSGFIISADGYILTNNHLVGKADKITAKLADGRELEAKLIGTDPESDIAVVKIDADKLTTLGLADSDKLEVGEWVIAIGNPFGLSHTVTAGIVSAKGRNRVGLAAFEDFIQTDAAINPGNSGGPLLNLDGKVVGINTAIVSRSGGNMGIGFAIPINMAKSIYEQLVDKGMVERGYLGIMVQDLSTELAESFDFENTKGVLIPKVEEDSAAEKAGIKQGDIVVEFEGKPAENANSFRNQVAMLKPGTKVKLVVLRDGERKTLTAVLGKRPTKQELAGKQSEILEKLGFSVQELTEELAEQLGYEDLAGVIVTEVVPGSLANVSGITRGMLILEVNKTPVENIEEFKDAIEKTAFEGSLLLLVRDKRHARYVVLPMPKD